VSHGCVSSWVVAALVAFLLDIDHMGYFGLF